MEDTSGCTGFKFIDDLLTQVDKDHEALVKYIQSMDLNELGVSIFPNSSEWAIIDLNRGITKDMVLRCNLPVERYIKLFPLDEFLENTTSNALYHILITYTKSDVIKALDYYEDNFKLIIADILKNTQYLPYSIILKYWENIEESEDALSSLCSNLFVPNAFFIQRKELFWKYRWVIGRRILDSKLCKAFKLVPYRCIPEEYERFHIIESGYDNEMTTKDAIKVLKGNTLPLADYLD